MVKLTPALLLLAATSLSDVGAKKAPGGGNDADNVNRVDIEGCIADPYYCGNDATSCCMVYYVPMCANLYDYGASVVNGGSLTCLTPEAPIPASAEEISDLQIELFPDAFKECLRQLNATEITDIKDCTALPDAVEAAEAATSSANTGASAFGAAGMAAAGIIGALAMN